MSHVPEAFFKWNQNPNKVAWTVMIFLCIIEFRAKLSRFSKAGNPCSDPLVGITGSHNQCLKFRNKSQQILGINCEYAHATTWGIHLLVSLLKHLSTCSSNYELKVIYWLSRKDLGCWNNIAVNAVDLFPNTFWRRLYTNYCNYEQFCITV